MTELKTSKNTLEDLDSLESFFLYFDLTFDPNVIQHQRIHLLRLFHQQLEPISDPISDSDYRTALERAYCLLKKNYIPAFSDSGCESCTKCKDDTH